MHPAERLGYTANLRMVFSKRCAAACCPSQFVRHACCLQLLCCDMSMNHKLNKLIDVGCIVQMQNNIRRGVAQHQAPDIQPKIPDLVSQAGVPGNVGYVCLSSSSVSRRVQQQRVSLLQTVHVYFHQGCQALPCTGAEPSQRAQSMSSTRRHLHVSQYKLSNVFKHSSYSPIHSLSI